MYLIAMETLLSWQKGGTLKVCYLKPRKFKLDELKKVHCSMQDNMKIKSLIFQIQTIIFCPE